LSVIGITDIRAASESYPALTTVAVQTREVAIHAINLLLGLLDHSIPADPPPLIVTPSAPALVLRESTAAPRKT
jgi:DNA-binding LacI/PurR family transcriptional regulator